MLNVRSICFTSYRIKFNSNYNVLCTSAQTAYEFAVVSVKHYLELTTLAVSC